MMNFGLAIYDFEKRRIVSISISSMCLIPLVLYADGITGADVGVKPNMQLFREQKTEGFPRIAYIQIHECDKFSVCEPEAQS